MEFSTNNHEGHIDGIPGDVSPLLTRGPLTLMHLLVKHRLRWDLPTPFPLGCRLKIFKVKIFLEPSCALDSFFFVCLFFFQGRRESEFLGHHYLAVNVAFPCYGRAGKGWFSEGLSVNIGWMYSATVLPPLALGF